MLVRENVVKIESVRFYSVGRRTASIIRTLEPRIRNPPPYDGEPKSSLFLAVSKTSASASTENNRQREQDDCDRYERSAGDVSEQDEDDRDDGEDCCDVVVHSFPIVGLPTLLCETTWKQGF